MKSRFWIGQSHARHPERGDVTGGSQFFHVYRPGARDCIAREFLAHGAVGLHGRCLVKWEEKIYRQGRRNRLPFPVLVSAQGTMVTTELVGPSVRMLLERPDLHVPLSEEEVASLVVNVLRASISIADAGFMPFDAHLYNFWVWLEEGLGGGHLDFSRVVLGDHTYTLVRGMDFRRPLWCSSEMPHFPPEARASKRADEDAFARELNGLGFPGTSLGDIVLGISRIADPRHQREQRWRLEQAYEEYQVPQQLQQDLDSGAIEPHRMIQYAVAAHLHNMDRLRELPAATRQVIAKCRPELERMADVRPERRFATLGEAADAVAACWRKALPERSIKPWPAIEPPFLIWDVRGGTDPDPASVAPGGDANRHGATFEIDGQAGRGSARTGGPAFDALPRFVSDPADMLRTGLTWLRARPVIPAAALLLLVSLGASVRVPQTPEQALAQAQQMKLRRLVQHTGDPNQSSAESAGRTLRSVLNDPTEPNRAFVLAQLDERFQKLRLRYLGKPLLPTSASPVSAPPAERKRLARELRELAALGHDQAGKWLAVLRELDGRVETAMR